MVSHNLLLYCACAVCFPFEAARSMHHDDTRRVPFYSNQIITLKSVILPLSIWLQHPPSRFNFLYFKSVQEPADPPLCNPHTRVQLGSVALLCNLSTQKAALLPPLHCTSHNVYAFAEQSCCWSC